MNIKTLFGEEILTRYAAKHNNPRRKHVSKKGLLTLVERDEVANITQKQLKIVISTDIHNLL